MVNQQNQFAAERKRRAGNSPLTFEHPGGAFFDAVVALGEQVW
jgi:hypothetical protein